MRESQADRNFALQDACSRGDEAAARKLMDGAETASVSRSLKKAGEKASTTILEMLLERLEREKALDRYDLAIALAWWAESESAGEEEERRRDEGLRRLAGAGGSAGAGVGSALGGGEDESGGSGEASERGSQAGRASGME